MSNPVRGQVDVDLGGETYPIRFTLNSLAEVQELFGAADLDAAVKRLQDTFGQGVVDVRTLRSLLTIAFRGGGWKGATEQEVGDLIGAEDLADVSQALSRALELGFGGGEKSRPPRAAAPKRQNGTVHAQPGLS